MGIVLPFTASLQKLNGIAHSFAKLNDMIYNVKMTDVVCIKPKCLKDQNVHVFCFNGRALRCVDKYRCLGVIISGDQSDNNDIYMQTGSIYDSNNMIAKRFRHCSDGSYFYCCQLRNDRHFLKSVLNKAKSTF